MRPCKAAFLLSQKTLINIQQKHLRFVHKSSCVTVRTFPHPADRGHFRRHSPGRWAAPEDEEEQHDAKANSEPSVKQTSISLKQGDATVLVCLNVLISNVMELVEWLKVGQWSTHGQMPVQGLMVSPQQL